MNASAAFYQVLGYIIAMLSYTRGMGSVRFRGRHRVIPSSSGAQIPRAVKNNPPIQTVEWPGVVRDITVSTIRIL